MLKDAVRCIPCAENEEILRLFLAPSKRDVVPPAFSVPVADDVAGRDRAVKDMQEHFAAKHPGTPMSLSNLEYVSYHEVGPQ